MYPLKGDRDGICSITVNGNWCITFELLDANAYILNYGLWNAKQQINLTNVHAVNFAVI
ncbi:hypothetical protein ACLKMH_16205 [Psychromonas sp. KJ10-10]|uniref:hypothetical protein n=1 Tax=Psychromonas sp. KJ10-10 TaxID=3391823 RepID=UPI0039B381FA